LVIILLKKRKNYHLKSRGRKIGKPCVVNLLIVGAACRVTIDENREPKFLILSNVALLFDVIPAFIVERGGISVAEKLIRLCNGSTASGKLFVLYKIKIFNKTIVITNL